MGKMAAKSILLLLFIVSVVMHLLAPAVFNQQFCNWCVLLYCVSLSLFYVIKKKKNYFDFDSIFFLTYFFVMFFYPAFMFADNATHFFTFTFEFNEDVISRATSLSLMGILAYMIGSISYKIDSTKIDVVKQVISPISTSLIVTLVNALFILVVLSGGYSLSEDYGEGYDAAKSTGIAGYINKFLFPLVYSILIINFYNLKEKQLSVFSFIKHSNRYALIVIGIYFVLMLLTGGRSVPLQILLILACVFTMFYKPIPFFKFVVLMILGITMMFGIVLMRGYTVEGNVSIVETVMDLVINNRNSFVAMDYVDKHGLTMGRSMLAPLLAPIPMAQSVVFSILNISPTDASSSMIITKLSLNSDELTLGFGTNIIADIYMSFGSVGVIICMSLLGFIVAKTQYLSRKSIYYLAIYAVLCSYAVFLVRAEFLTFVCYTLWVLAFINIAKLHKINLVFCKKRFFQ